MELCLLISNNKIDKAVIATNDIYYYDSQITPIVEQTWKQLNLKKFIVLPKFSLTFNTIGRHKLEIMKQLTHKDGSSSNYTISYDLYINNNNSFIG